jgi:hypothetical protein
MSPTPFTWEAEELNHAMIAAGGVAAVDGYG